MSALTGTLGIFLQLELATCHHHYLQLPVQAIASRDSVYVEFTQKMPNTRHVTQKYCIHKRYT